MVIEKRVAEGEPLVTVAVFTLQSIDDWDRWLAMYLEESDEIAGRVVVAGRPKEVVGYSSYAHGRILRTVIPPGDSGISKETCLLIVVDAEVQPGIGAALADAEVLTLLDRQLFLPEGGVR